MPYRTTEIPIGTRFGRLSTLARPFLRPRSDGRRRSWVSVICDCGTRKDVPAGNLLNGITASCGCYHRERASEANTVHGHARGHRRTHLLQAWKGMRNRCLDPNASNHRYYGGKGISITPDWDTFLPFAEWAHANGYAVGLELDRIDSQKDYGPDNCRWVTKKQNIRTRDHAWDDELDAKLIAFAARIGKDPYEVIAEALKDYLPRQRQADLPREPLDPA